jgi:predicted transcriptional regulator
MFTVRDLMATAPVTLEPEETLRSAADLLTSSGVSGAPVVAGTQVVGVATLSDILAFEADDPGVPTLRDQPTLSPDEPAEDPELLEEPAGRWFLEMWDDVGADVETRMEAANTPEWAALDQHVVSEVMTRTVLYVSPDATIQEAADMMERERVHRLLVLDDGKLVGILSAWDVVRAVARGALTAA